MGAPARRIDHDAHHNPPTLELVDREEVRERGRGARKLAWALILLVLLLAGGFAAFYAKIHEPVALALADARQRATGAEHDRDAEHERAAGLERERDTLRTERDTLRTERDALRSRETELSSAVAERDARIAAMRAMQESLEEQLRGEIASGDVTIEQSDGRIAVRLADQILFAPGHAELSERGRAVIRRVSVSLARMQDRMIQVEGHTDSTPLAGEALQRFPSNWELSTARATTVVRFLSEETGLPGERLIAAGFGEFRPVADNATAAGRRRNRRIELTLAAMRPS
jgi:chemotaxis protein MotB